MTGLSSSVIAPFQALTVGGSDDTRSVQRRSAAQPSSAYKNQNQPVLQVYLLCSYKKKVRSISEIGVMNEIAFCLNEKLV